MDVTLQPMTHDCVADVAQLLATRHREDRAEIAVLPAGFEDPALAEALVLGLLAEEGVETVVATRGGRVCGFMAGIPIPDEPERSLAGFTKLGSVDIPLAGYAIAPDQSSALMRRLYGELAQSWVARGLRTHCVVAPASARWASFWADLEMGRLLAMGARSTAQARAPQEPPPGITLRAALPADLDALETATVELVRSFAEPPMFVPYLEEGQANQREQTAQALADHAGPIWVAVDAAGALQGFFLCYEPTSPHWVPAPLESPERALYIEFAYIKPQARSTGLGGALIDHTLAHARAAGYETVTTHWVTASRASDFWQRHGFRPVTHWLRRSIDERAATHQG